MTDGMLAPDPRTRWKAVIDIRPACFPADLNTVRTVFQEYADGLGIDLAFQGFQAELDDLPGAYARPGGIVLLARQGLQVIGCVAMRPFTHDTCEMKRLYVRPMARGMRTGRQLVERLCAEALAAGYARICLDTLPSMHAAHALYHGLGFRPIAPHAASPIAGTRYLGRSLR